MKTSLFLGFCGVLLCLPAFAQARERESFDFDWRFTTNVTSSAEQPAFDDTTWPVVNLPHDWAIAGPIASHNPTAAGGGFFPAGIGWYRKTFEAPAAWTGKRVQIEFDGVYQDSTVWINGQKVGERPYGYSSFVYDLTPYLTNGARNVVAVKVDNSRHVNSRWYSGSGIYRHVWLTVAEPLHVAYLGVFISTPAVSAESAAVSARIEVRNDGDQSKSCVVRVRVLASDGREVATGSSTNLNVSKGTTVTTVPVRIARPQLWSPERPALYRAIIEVVEAGKTTGSVSQSFGIRTITVSAARGFELNGRSIKLNGGCVHHDNGALGAAAFDRAEERKVELLKAGGYNAVRTAHNPPSPAFLDASDRLGLLVMDEIFDCWRKGKNGADYSTFYEEWWKTDLDDWVRRDRNHPSVIMWDLGNELPDAGTTIGIGTTAQLATRVRQLDSTRPLTAAMFWWNGMPWKWEDADPAFAQLDVAGYNYALYRIAGDAKRVPGRVFVSTESYLKEPFRSWELAQDRTDFIGDFVWSAIDYLGEAGIGRYFPPGEKPFGHNNPKHYPYHGGYCGDIDLTGFRKPISHYRDILWNKTERVYAAVLEPTPDGRPFRTEAWGIVPSWPGWTWPGYEGTNLTVEVYGNGDAVQLFLNDKLVGESPTTRKQQFKASFAVPYAPGTLRAVTLEGGKKVAESVLQTAGAPAGLRLTADRTTLRADGQDLSFVTVESVDAGGKPQPNGDQMVSFSLGGPGTIAGVASGDFNNEDSYQGNQRRLFHGRAQIVIRTARSAGEIRLNAQAPGLNSANAILVSKAP